MVICRCIFLCRPLLLLVLLSLFANVATFVSLSSHNPLVCHANSTHPAAHCPICHPAASFCGAGRSSVAAWRGAASVDARAPGPLGGRTRRRNGEARETWDQRIVIWQTHTDTHAPLYYIYIYLCVYVRVYIYIYISLSLSLSLSVRDHSTTNKK